MEDDTGNTDQAPTEIVVGQSISGWSWIVRRNKVIVAKALYWSPSKEVAVAEALVAAGEAGVVDVPVTYSIPYPPPFPYPPRKPLPEPPVVNAFARVAPLK